MARRRSWIGLFLVAATLAACGGNGSNDAAGPPPASQPAGNDAPPPTPEPAPQPLPEPRPEPASPPPPPLPTPSQQTPSPEPVPTAAIQLSAPILFVTQTPIRGADFTIISSTFGHHLPTAPRGGDLWIAYPKAGGGVDLRNLTREAGLGTVGGAPHGEPLPSVNSPGAIAARDPAVDWDGQRALVSLLIGTGNDKRWQIYEVQGLAKGQPVTFKRVEQPAAYNNINAIYGLEGDVYFVSDIPRPGPGAQHKHLYPLLDEYEEKPTPTGIWRLNRGDGSVALMHHAPSGAFRPQVDSFGRLVFTNWDHLQRDQQAPGYGVFNFRSEAADAVTEPVNGPNTQVFEVFPEPRFTSDAVINQHEFNLFLPWMANLDGTGAETLNHVGRQELGVFGAMSRKGVGLSDQVGAQGINAGFANQGIKLGAFHFLREDPCTPGSYYAVRAVEFGRHGAGSILTIDGRPPVRPQQMKVTLVTPAESNSAVYRSPLPLAECGGGQRSLIASASTVTTLATSSTPNLQYDFRLYRLTPQGGNYGIGSRITLTPGEKSLSKTLDGATVNLWELDPAEVRARTRPAATAMEPVPAPEQQVFAEAGVDVQALRNFLREHELALISVRDTTRRDGFDKAQPFNLQVRRADGTGGASSVKSASNATPFMVDHLQIFQADQVRGIKNNPAEGRRVLAQPMSPLAVNGVPVNPPATPGVAKGSMRVHAGDGSVAAIVPARRALTWQLIDSQNPGDPKRGTDGIVRERFHISFQPGEVRVCANCHGVSDKDQTGALHDNIANPPLALRQLLEHIKLNFGEAATGR